ncbi:MAG: adenine-specific DNA-methyltransferase, partial [Thermodesulfobacteriota bacterium]|nr:adenine-specific DNA-methyltransferase [Thermodesulfobacteriota bacterium]
ELPASVDASFADLLDQEGKGASERLRELKTQIVSETEDDQAILPDGTIRPECANRAGKTLKALIAEYEELRRKSQERASLEEQKDDTYNHLYAFFSRYYDEGDFIPRHFFGARNRYVVPYNGEETLFHWANKDQYYVKSGENFRDYAFQVETVAGPWRIQFKIVEASTPPGNTKGDTRFFFPQIPGIEVDHESRNVTIPFHYRLPTEQEIKRYGPKSKGQAALLHEAGPAILKAIPDPMLAGVLAATAYQTEKETLTLLDKRLRHFTRKNTTDFFVHKRLREFLLDELEFYIRDQVVHLMDMEADAAALERKRLSVRVFRRLSEQIIDFLARIEEAQKTLFEKKKFALAVDYLAPIQHVPETLRAEVLSNKTQIDQWKGWYSIKPKKDLFNQKGEINHTFLDQHPTLPVDTRCFDTDFKLRLLCALSDHFGDLDEATDGLLIHSENFQALNYLLPRYEGGLNCIYIDPPYNTGDDINFPYKDGYQESTWLTLIQMGSGLAKQLLSQEGLFFIQIGDQESAKSSILLGECFLERKNSAVVRRGIKNVQAQFKDIDRLTLGHDIVHIMAQKRGMRIPHLISSLEDPKPGKWDTFWRGTDRPTMRYKLFDQQPDKGQWRWEEKRAYKAKEIYDSYLKNEAKFKTIDQWYVENLQAGIDLDFVRLNNDGVVQYYVPPQDYRLVSDNWLDIPASGSFTDFPHEKSLALVKRTCAWVTGRRGYVLDYFAGSGTSGHVVIELNRSDGGKRKFILVEMGDYFNTVLVPRIAKVMYTPEWKEGKPKRKATQEEADRTPRLVKILKLESHEDALHNLTKEEQIKGVTESEETDGMRRICYVLERLMEKSDAMLNWEALDRPFDYTMEVLTDEGVKTTPVDLVETFNALYGLRVQRFEIWQDSETHREYRVIKAARGDEGKVLVIWRNVPPEKEAARDRAFLEEHIGDLGQWNEAWINGPCAMPGFKPLDGTFKRLILGFRN